MSQCLHVVCASGAQGDQGVRSPEIQVTDTCELPLSAGNRTWSSANTASDLTNEPSL